MITPHTDLRFHITNGIARDQLAYLDVQQYRDRIRFSTIGPGARVVDATLRPTSEAYGRVDELVRAMNEASVYSVDLAAHRGLFGRVKTWIDVGNAKHHTTSSAQGLDELAPAVRSAIEGVLEFASTVPGEIGAAASTIDRIVD